MARTGPILLALIFSFSSQCFAGYASINDAKLLSSTYIIRFALYFLLLELPLYSRSLRKISVIPESILQFVIGLFIIESAVVYIWFPLENVFLCIIPLISSLLLPYFGNWSAMQSFLWNNVNAKSSYLFSGASFLLSLFIFCCILHGTRAVDFRILRYCGFANFFDDSMFRFKRGFHRIVKKRWSYSGRKARKR